MRRPQVLIVQELMAHYRIDFHLGLTRALAESGIDLTVAYGQASAERAKRADEQALPGGVVVTNRHLRLGTRTLVWQPVVGLSRRMDLVIVEHANRMLVNYVLLGLRRFGGSRFAFWGHGRNRQSRDPHGARERMKRWMARRPDWWFAYTDGAARDVMAAGFPAERITVVQNSLRPACSDPAPVKVPGRCVFLGSLYADKRLDYLVAAADAAANKVAGFSLVVIGDGPERTALEVAAATRPWLRVVGPLRGDALADALGGAQAMVLTGLVGLPVIEAFAAQAPVVTVEWPHHSPEFDYLVDGVNARVLPAGTAAKNFGVALAALLNDEPLLAGLRAGCRAARDHYSLDVMVDNFATGIRKALGVG